MMRKLLALMAAAASGVILSAADAADTTAPAAGGPMTPAAAAAPAPAATAAPATAAPAEPAAATSTEPASQVAAKGPPIVVEAGKGTLIRLPSPASTVFIANPDIADVAVKSPTLIYVTAKQPGQTVLYAVDSGDHVLLNAPVRVEQDLSGLRQTLGAAAPGENVNVSSVDNSLVLSGKVSSAGRAEAVRSLAAAVADSTKGKVINRLGVATPNQVNIRVKIAEVDRTVLKDLGLNWSKVGQHVNFATNNVTNPSTSAENALSFVIGGSGSQLIGMLDVLGQEGLVTTLAEPNLTATNGQPASFLAGGEFPVPTTSSAGSGGVPVVTVTFKQFGVQLNVTPTIVDPEHVTMAIRTEVSQLSTTGAVVENGFSIPGLTERSADTTVELGSGQSFMLGGLLQNNSTQNISKVPWLGDIPVLGQLFRSQSFQRNESELVIVVTPYLVKPTLTSSLALPTDGFVAPHDAQRVINGDTYQPGLPAPARGPLGAGGQGLIGPVGFRLD
ncbi:MAG TPA: type II and III secretion system protein family protein [Stellaceae bacterium]|nr:type II and III secretion system protein family protein [Stellaceae bacterium]